MHVAVIDDGINPRAFRDVPPLVHDVEVTEGLRVSPRTRPVEGISHGTACAAILCKYARSVQLSSVKVLEKDGRGNREHLIRALEWCVEQHIPLVHMSMGSTLGGDLEPVAKAVGELQRAGGVLVASWSNGGKFTAPAGLPGVLSVKTKTSDALDQPAYTVNPLPYLDAELIACSRHTLRLADGGEYVTPRSNSFASPVVTAEANRLLNGNPRLRLRELREKVYFGAANAEEHARQWAHTFHRTGWSCNGAEAGWVWNPGIVAEAAKKTLAEEARTGELAMPVVAVSGIEALCHIVTVGLSEAMRERGYYAKVVCEDPIDEQGMEYLPQGVDIPAFLALIARKFEPAAILLCTNRAYPAWDVLVNVRPDGYRLRTEEGGDFGYALCSQEEMFANILRMLEPEEAAKKLPEENRKSSDRRI